MFPCHEIVEDDTWEQRSGTRWFHRRESFKSELAAQRVAAKETAARTSGAEKRHFFALSAIFLLTRLVAILVQVTQFSNTPHEHPSDA